MEKETCVRFGSGKRTMAALVWGLLFMTFAGCSSSNLVQSWQDPSFDAGPLNRFLVLGMFNPDVNRRIYEDGFVGALEAQGAAGVAGYTLMPEQTDYDEKEEIRDAVKNSGADGVMLATLLGVETEERYVPPKVEYVPTRHHSYRLYDYYRSSYEAVYHPGYTVTDKVVRLEIVVFSTTSEKMVWSGVTRSVNLSSGEAITKETATLVIRDMKKAGLL